MDNLVKILDSFHPGWKERKHVDRFITILKERVIPTYSLLHAKIENNRAVFHEEWNHIISALKEARFFKLFVPVEYGGQESSEQEIYFMMERFGYASPGAGVIFVSHGRAIDLIFCGTQQQKERYLPRMGEGDFGAIAMTEEKAGSDASAVGLRAERVGDHYLFNGKKIFISNSGLAYRIFHEIYHYAHRRRQFDHPLTGSQGISFEISDMFTRINSARGLCIHALGQVGTPYYRMSSSQAKLFASQVVMDVAAKAQILMGGRGYFKDDLVNQLSADARGMEYLEGTSNIQKMIIARELFKMYHKERMA